MSMGPKPFRSLLEEDNSEYYETTLLSVVEKAFCRQFGRCTFASCWLVQVIALLWEGSIHAQHYGKQFCPPKYGITPFLKFLWGILPLWVLLMKQLKICCWLSLIFTSARRSCDLCALSNKGRIKKHIWVLNYAGFVDEGLKAWCWSWWGQVVN